jgi:hypothetical protein
LICKCGDERGEIPACFYQTPWQEPQSAMGELDDEMLEKLFRATGNIKKANELKAKIERDKLLRPRN